MTIPFALSVTHFINTVGADAGFAAIIGLAILVLLYFAQARETATLREQASHAAEHVQQLEYRLGQLARTGAPAPAPAPAQRAGAAPAQPVAAPAASRTIPPGRVPAPVVAPAAPAGVGAPALASATRLIPSLDDAEISIRATGAPIAAGAAAAGGQGNTPGRGGGAAVMSPPGPPPATAAGGANGGSTGRTNPAPVAANAVPPRAAGQAAARPPVRNGAARPLPPSPRRPAGPPRRSGARGLILALAGLAGVAVIVVVLLVLTAGSSTNSHSSSSTAPISNAAGKSRHRAGRGRTAIKPSSVTVAVLNGTSTPNLAHDTSVRLGGVGYKLGTVATATDQTQTTTVVGYLPGQRDAALIVAKSLGLGPASVQAVGASNQAVACPQAASCTAQVVVTVGSDFASAASSSSTPGATAAPSGTTTASATT